MTVRRLLHTLPPWVITLFFMIGAISTFCFRVIIIWQHVQPSWIRPTWYIGAIGYIFFFLYRYWISEKRKHVVAEYGLIEKLKSGAALSEEDTAATVYLLSSIQKSKEHWNYLLIFLFSVLAVGMDLFLSHTH